MQLVSIVIGTYNGEKYIETQLKSIVSQTYKNIEIIIVDDSSNDNTVAIINEFAEKHNNINIHPFKENVGYIKNFERGIALANGELISLSDQDDWWEPKKTEKLVANIKNHDLIYCDSSFVDEKLNSMDSSFSKIKNMINSNNPVHFLIDNCVSGHAALFKKELYNKATPFPKLIPHDWWLTFIASANNGVTYLNEPLVKYRHHQNNVIASNKKKKEKEIKLHERRHRIDVFYKNCPEALIKEKEIIGSINDAYKSFSIKNNFKRIIVFLKHQKELLIIIKKSNFKKIIFSINMFFKIK